jgi:hypothetical protein
MSPDPMTENSAVSGTDAGTGPVPEASEVSQTTTSGHAVTAEKPALSMATRAVHGDDGIAVHRAVAPPMHVSTTYRYNSDPDQLQTWVNVDVSLIRVLPLSAKL